MKFDVIFVEELKRKGRKVVQLVAVQSTCERFPFGLHAGCRIPTFQGTPVCKNCRSPHIEASFDKGCVNVGTGKSGVASVGLGFR